MVMYHSNRMPKTEIGTRLGVLLWQIWPCVLGGLWWQLNFGLEKPLSAQSSAGCPMLTEMTNMLRPVQRPRPNTAYVPGFDPSPAKQNIKHTFTPKLVSCYGSKSAIHGLPRIQEILGWSEQTNKQEEKQQWKKGVKVAISGKMQTKARE